MGGFSLRTKAGSGGTGQLLGDLDRLRPGWAGPMARQGWVWGAGSSPAVSSLG